MPVAVCTPIVRLDRKSVAERVRSKINALTADNGCAIDEPIDRRRRWIGFVVTREILLSQFDTDDVSRLILVTREYGRVVKYLHIWSIYVSARRRKR